MVKSVIHARLLLETAPDRAESSAAPLIDMARSMAPSMTVRSGPYWKIESYSEVNMEMAVADDAESALARLMGVVGIGWKISGATQERSGVWQGHGTPLMPALRWANLELFPAPA